MDFKSLIFQWINPLNLREIITSESNQIMARHFSDASKNKCVIIMNLRDKIIFTKILLNMVKTYY